MSARYTTLIAIVIGLLLCKPASAQLRIGIQGGGNLSKAVGNDFRSINRIGFQFGAIFTYQINRYFAGQLEPGYIQSRIRTNETTTSLPNGLNKGTFSLGYFNLPLLAKLSITPQFALLAGVELNKLANEDAYRLNNGTPAFSTRISTGYALGVELGKFYFRYRRQHNFSEINRPNDAYMRQLQLGLRLLLM